MLLIAPGFIDLHVHFVSQVVNRKKQLKQEHLQQQKVDLQQLLQCQTQDQFQILKNI